MTKDPPSNELGAAGMKMERRIAAAADAGANIGCCCCWGGGGG
jgi:hypothetical protein